MSSPLLSSLRDSRARAEVSARALWASKRDPRRARRRKSRVAGARSERPSRPAEGQRVSRGPRVLAGAPRPLPELPALFGFADALARPHEHGLPFLPAGTWTWPAPSRSPPTWAAESPPLSPAPCPRPPPGGGRHVTPPPARRAPPPRPRPRPASHRRAPPTRATPAR